MISTGSTLVTIAAVLAGSVTAPLFLLWITGRQRRTERLEDREDRVEVARAAKEAAEVTAASANRAAEQVTQVAAQAREAAALAAQVAAQASAEATAVAAQAREAAALLLQQQAQVAVTAAEVARQIVKSNELVVSGIDASNSKLDVVHTLVNSQMTTALESELGATERQLALMHELSAMRAGAGLVPSQESDIAIHATEEKIVRLKSDLKIRARQAATVAKQIAEEPAAAIGAT